MTSLKSMDDWIGNVHCKKDIDEIDWEKNYIQCDREVYVRLTWESKGELKEWNGVEWTNGQVRTLKIPNSIDKYGFTPTATVCYTNAVCYTIVDDMHISWFSVGNVCTSCFSPDVCTCEKEEMVSEERIKDYLKRWYGR